MRFPLPLRIALAKKLIAQLGRSPAGTFFHHIDPSDVLHADSAQPISHAKIHELVRGSKRLIWVGGSEPLQHAGVGHLVRALTGAGHIVFMETDGVLLRPRIHEFQPLSGFFLVVRLEPRQLRSKGRHGVTNAFELALEGIRAAQLSGFHTIAHSVIAADVDFAELERFGSLVEDLGLDGWLATAGDESAVEKAARARKMIPEAGWRFISEKAQDSVLGRRDGTKRAVMAGGFASGLEGLELAQTVQLSEASTEGYEKSVDTR